MDTARERSQRWLVGDTTLTAVVEAETWSTPNTPDPPRCWPAPISRPRHSPNPDPPRSMAVRRRTGPNYLTTTVIEQGDAGDEFFVVANGEAEVRRGSRTIARIEPGGFFGEMSLLDDDPRSATVTTSGPATLLAIDRGTFRALLLSCPDVAVSLLEALSGRVRLVEG